MEAAVVEEVVVIVVAVAARHLQEVARLGAAQRMEEQHVALLVRQEIRPPQREHNCIPGLRESQPLAAARLTRGAAIEAARPFVFL